MAIVAPLDSYTPPVCTIRSAVISDCGTYRYELARIWDPRIRPALFIGLNPSTADGQQDDPTIRRCVRFAAEWGYGGLLMGNLFAYRATNPAELPGIDSRPAISAIGEAGEWRNGVRLDVNDQHLQAMASRAGIIIAAWGAHKAPYGWAGRAAYVRRQLGQMHALGFTKDGEPRHPLYMPATARPVPMAITDAT